MLCIRGGYPFYLHLLPYVLCRSNRGIFYYPLFVIRISSDIIFMTWSRIKLQDSKFFHYLGWISVIFIRNFKMIAMVTNQSTDILFNSILLLLVVCNIINPQNIIRVIRDLKPKCEWSFRCITWIIFRGTLRLSILCIYVCIWYNFLNESSTHFYIQPPSIENMFLLVKFYSQRQMLAVEN